MRSPGKLWPHCWDENKSLWSKVDICYTALYIRQKVEEEQNVKKDVFLLTWNYSSDGRASPTDAGDYDEAEAFVLQPGDADVVGVTLSVTL